MTYSGHIQNGVVVFDQPIPLPNGTEVRVEPKDMLTNSFWQSLTLEELAIRQGVTAPQSIDEMMGGWPADEIDDDFENVFRQWRDAELEENE